MFCYKKTRIFDKKVFFMIKIPKNKELILFDGVCNLCNISVQKIIRFDKQDKFIFASLQSEIGQEIIKEAKIDSNKIDSVILYTNNNFYIKSSAVLKITNDFGGLWKTTQIFWILPKFIRDFLYDIVAKNRYKWFGKNDKCLIPSNDLKSKFLI